MKQIKPPYAPRLWPMRRNIVFSAAAAIVAAVLLLIPVSANAAPSSPFEGSYVGIYAVDLGGASATVGTIAVDISAAGALTLTSTSPENGGATSIATGTVNALGSLRATYTGSSARLTGSLVISPITHSLTAIYSVVANGTVLGSIFTAGPANVSSLANSYAGTTSIAGFATNQFSINIADSGIVTGTVLPANSSHASIVYGYVDSNNKLYLVYSPTSGSFGMLDGTVALSSTYLSGTVAVETSSTSTKSEELQLSPQ